MLGLITHAIYSRRVLLHGAYYNIFHESRGLVKLASNLNAVDLDLEMVVEYGVRLIECVFNYASHTSGLEK